MYDEIHNSKIIVVSLLGLLLIISYLFGRDKGPLRKGLLVGFGLCAFTAMLSYFNWGAFQGSWGLVHTYEQYHFYFGSQYLEELRYDNIYKATVVAAGEDWPSLPKQKMRDPITFKISSTNISPQQAKAVRARFSDKRWSQFKSDLHFFGSLKLPVKRVIKDHGNTGSPAWSLVARMFTGPLGASKTTVNIYAMLDVALMLVLFIAMVRSFGAEAACTAIVICLTAPRAYDYLGGSFLRLDWLFALGMSACAIKSNNPKTAGAFLGYAILSKPFCAMVALALGTRFIVETIKSRKINKDHFQLVVAAFSTAVGFVLLSSLWFGFNIWPDYAHRITSTLNEGFYNGQHSFRDVFFQFAHGDFSPIPKKIFAAKVNFSQWSTSYFLARASMLAGFVFVIARRDINFAFGLGILMIFSTMVANIYYWQMLMFPAAVFAFEHRKDASKLVFALFICWMTIAKWHFKINEGPTHLEGYLGSYLLFTLCVFVMIVEMGRFLMTRVIKQALVEPSKEIS